MNLSGVPSFKNNQTVLGRTETNSAQGGNSNSAGWKYVTITEGDTAYTYIVIGENMKVLIGKAAVDKDEDKDKKTSADKMDKENLAGQNEGNLAKDEKVNFLIDPRMLGLTGFYQKKLREAMKSLEDQVGCDKINYIDTKKEVSKLTKEPRQ